jgi:hypothetical protein
MINYSILAEENLLFCNISEEIKLLDLTNYINQLLNDKNFHSKLNAIINISENTKINYASEAAGIGRFFTHFLQQRKHIAWAFVMSSNTTMSLTRLVVDEIDCSSIYVDYFSTEEEAKKWIVETK